MRAARILYRLLDLRVLLDKRKRNFVPKVAIRLPSVQPNPPPSSRQTTISESAGNLSHDTGIDFEMAQVRWVCIRDAVD